MKTICLIVIAVLFFSQTASADCSIVSLLKVGSRGAQVECLQTKVGATTDGSFGPLTRAAVMVFQSSHRLATDGIVGPLSRAQLNLVAIGSFYPPGCTSTMGYSSTTGARCDSSANSVVNNNITKNVLPDVLPPVALTIPLSQPPKVFSVSPEKVRSGDTVKIYGENFSSTGNTVRLRYGQIEDRFENLASSDGKLISFVYQPPEVKTMNKEEVLNLPPTILNKILDPVQAVGGSVDDIVAPYRNMKNENDLQQLLNNTGHSFDELYDKFYVTIENSYGRGSSGEPILTGLRKLSFGSNLSILNNKIFSPVFRSFADIFTPKKAYAQTPEGGYNSGIIMYCTCGSGYLTFMTDFSSNGGTGLYWWSPGFIPTVGNPMIAAPQLGFYTKNAGTCSIGVRPYCADVTANTASLPWGEGI